MMSIFYIFIRLLQWVLTIVSPSSIYVLLRGTAILPEQKGLDRTSHSSPVRIRNFTYLHFAIAL